MSGLFLCVSTRYVSHEKCRRKTDEIRGHSTQLYIHYGDDDARTLDKETMTCIYEKDEHRFILMKETKG